MLTIVICFCGRNDDESCDLFIGGLSITTSQLGFKHFVARGLGTSKFIGQVYIRAELTGYPGTKGCARQNFTLHAMQAQNARTKGCVRQFLHCKRQ